MARSAREFPPLAAMLVIVVVTTGTMGAWAWTAYHGGTTMAGSVVALGSPEKAAEIDECVCSCPKPHSGPSFILKPADNRIDRVNKRLIQIIDLAVPTLLLPLLIMWGCHAFTRSMVVGIDLLPRQALPRDPSPGRTIEWLHAHTDVAISDPLTRFRFLPRSVRGPPVVPFAKVGLTNAISEREQPWHNAAQREVLQQPYSRTALAVQGRRGRWFCVRAPESWTQLGLIEQALTEQSGWLFRKPNAQARR